MTRFWPVFGIGTGRSNQELQEMVFKKRTDSMGRTLIGFPSSKA